VSDLSLVPIEDLKAEIFKRSDIAIVAWVRFVDTGDPVIEVDFHGGNVSAVGLAETTKNLCLRKIMNQVGEAE